MTTRVVVEGGGLRGPAGARGAQGYEGPQGDTGPTGAQGLPGVNAVENDTAVAGYVADPDSETATAVAESIDTGQVGKKLGPLSRAWRAEAAQFIVTLYGMSITNFGNSPVQVAAQQLRRALGTVGETFINAGKISGDFETPVNGWKFQPFGGPGNFRARGQASSTALTYWFYGNTYRFIFGRETNSEAVNVEIDGVVVGATPSAGSQDYHQVVAGTVANGFHRLKINAPTGAGFVYWHSFLGYDSTRPGVIVLDFTRGGLNLNNMNDGNQPTSSGQIIAAVPTTAGNGIKGHYDHTDADLFMNGMDVNDTGSAALFAATMATVVGYCEARNRPLVCVSTPEGHFARATDPDHATMAATRTTYRDLERTSRVVTHWDWRNAVAPDYTNPAAVTAWIAAHYTPGGDEIHPKGIANDAESLYPPGVALACRSLGIPMATKADAGLVAKDTTRRPLRIPTRVPASVITRKLLDIGGNGAAHVTFAFIVDGSPGVVRFTTPHGLRPGDKVIGLTHYGWGNLMPVNGGTRYVKTVLSATEVTLAATVGGAALAASGGNTYAEGGAVYTEVIRRSSDIAGYAAEPIGRTFATPRAIPYFVDQTVGNLAYYAQQAIDASGTSDTYGPYLNYNNVNVSPGLDADVVHTLVIRAAQPTQSVFSISTSAPWRLCDAAGNVAIGATSEGSDQFVWQNTAEGEPFVVAAHIINHTATGGAGSYATVNAERVYDISIVRGALPIIGGWPTA